MQNVFFEYILTMSTFSQLTFFFMFEIPFKYIKIQTIFFLGLKQHWLKQKDGKRYIEKHVHFQV
jgi:hypothetical protein